MIRQRFKDDFPALEQALREVHAADGYPSVWPADPRAFLAPPLTVSGWVAEFRGEVVGQVLLRGVPEQVPGWMSAAGLPAPEVLVLSRLFVAPAGRGRGLARRLFRTAWAGAQALGKRAVLDVHHRNLAAIRLYESEGWRRVGTVDGDWLDPGGSVPRVHVYVAP
ncbi:GNAT family N-acetyltransferase [Deinococcus aluminii]|uniref:N-acetyltransferase domain-containing protein n=1 Tax=Deinococcus aluminii TaxID=1656885 RepID=A0ABP9XJS6_9DEIO